jgi:UDP-N-acetylmuramyl tripeptide synthase
MSVASIWRPRSTTREALENRGVASIDLQDSRRLTGPNLVAEGPGAVIDGRLEGVDATAFREAWRIRVREALESVGWSGESTSERIYDGGISVFHPAPIDALYAATQVNEWAWEAAAADIGAASVGGPGPETAASFQERVRALIQNESNPRLLRLRDAAAEHGVTFLSDDEEASVGTGTGAHSWAVDTLPDPEEVPWDEVHDIPRVLVTGTNGKTTTVRMIHSIVTQAGRITGFTCTDGIHVNGELVDGGDWSGPGGARAVLRDRRVELAILETARGGMLRRGLAVDRAQGALVTNVAADHLGEWGILTVDDVATAKLTVAKAVRHGKPLVINADDQVLARAARTLDRLITWTAVDRAAEVRTHLGPAEEAWVLQDGWIVRLYGSTSEPVIDVSEIPATLGGAAIYNVRNALGAAALAYSTGLDIAAIASGLAAFDSSPESSPGRLNLFDVGGVTVLVDFVHNPHGLEAMGKLIKELAPRRLGMMIGHAGDRDDGAITDLAQAAWKLRPARVAVKELDDYRRGREPGEVPAIIRNEMMRLGAAEDLVTLHADEVDAAQRLLAWAQTGDLLLLSTQAQRDAVLELVAQMQGNTISSGAEPS